MSAKKTYKRELSVALFLGLFTLAYRGETELVKILAAPTYLFGSLAFGLDWAGKSGWVLKPTDKSDT